MGILQPFCIDFICSDVDEQDIEAKDQQKAAEEKELGNIAYKRRALPAAISHYQAAVRLDPGEMVYWSNLAAALFETGAYREVSGCSQ